MADGTCFKTFSWIFQILVWVFLILMIVGFVSDGSTAFKVVFISLFACSYITYISLEFCSTIAKFACNKLSESGICKVVGSYYRSYPVFKFYCECYHYEKRRTRVAYTHKGRTRYRTKTVRVKITTHRETYEFPYYSERDVSGLFYLDCDRAYMNRKYYIQLYIDDEINFADAVSYMDYENAKDRFWRRNRFRDVHFYFKASRYIPGLVRDNLITITDNEPCCTSFFFSISFTQC